MASNPSRRLLWGDLAVGTTASFEFSVSDEEMAGFAELSGDFNPLHTDDAFARDRHFERKVVYGALILAKVSRLIGMDLPGQDSVWAKINFLFKRPLYVGQVASLVGTISSLSDATGLVDLKLELRAEGRLLAKGVAEVLLVSR